MVRVGLLGTGGIARVHASAYGQIPQAQLVALADINLEAAERLAREHGAPGARVHGSMGALLADPLVDVVDICLPTYLHEWAVCAAAAAAKHVLVEKPVALALDQADRMVDAVRRAGVQAMVAQVIRFWAQYRTIKERLESGELGTAVWANVARLGRLPRTGSKWFADPVLSGGALLDLAIHDLDWLYYLFGMPRSVYALGQRSQRGAWDHVVTTLDYGEVKATAETTFLMPDNYPFTMIFRLLGTQGFAEYRYSGSQSDPRLAALGTFAVYRNGQAPEFPEPADPNAYLNEIRYFIETLDAGQAPAIATLIEARNVLEIATAVRSSLESGQVISLCDRVAG